MAGPGHRSLLYHASMSYNKARYHQRYNTNWRRQRGYNHIAEDEMEY